MGAVLNLIAPGLYGGCVQVLEDKQGPVRSVRLEPPRFLFGKGQAHDSRFHFVLELLRTHKIGIVRTHKTQ